MPKLACPCGFVHDLSPIPDDGWVTVRDQDIEVMLDAEVASRQRFEDRVAGFWGSLYACATCGRLMWAKPGETLFTVFRREPNAEPLSWPNDLRKNEAPGSG